MMMNKRYEAVPYKKTFAIVSYDKPYEGIKFIYDNMKAKDVKNGRSELEYDLIVVSVLTPEQEEVIDTQEFSDYCSEILHEIIGAVAEESRIIL